MASETVTLIAAALAFAASIVATTVSIYNARLRRFVSERWWERKADSYTRIVESLSALVDYYDRSYYDMIRVVPIGETEKDRLLKQWAESSVEIAKATHIGAFLISQRARDALRQHAHDTVPDPRIDWQMEIDRDYKLAKRCLEEIVAAAIADLGVEGRPPR